MRLSNQNPSLQPDLFDRDFSQLIQEAKNVKDGKVEINTGFPNSFWCFPKTMEELFSGNKDCCFWHRRGLPIRFKEKHPMYD